MIHDYLTDYQIADAFGDTLSLIYKDKMKELHIILTPVYNHLDRLTIPRISDFERDFARRMARLMYPKEMEAVEHIQKIRRLYKKMKDTHENATLTMKIEKARNVPISNIYPFIHKGKNVRCPFHEDKTPSASIKFNRLICFSCGKKLDSIGLFMELNKTDFKEAVERLNKL